jgi:cytoskeleton protein RodZ
LLAAWWWNKQQNQEPPVSLEVQSSRTDENASTEGVVDSDIQAGSETPIATDATTMVAESDSSDSSDAAVTAEIENTTENDSAADTAVEPVAAEVAETDTAADQVSSTEAVALPVETESSSSTEAVALPVEAESSSSAEEPEPQATGTRDQPTRIAPSGSDKLKIIIHADTWADVKDSTNFQLVYDLLRADSSVELSGKAPFTVFLGNGHGVEILFNDEEVGFSTRIRDDNTARIDIGG